MERRDSRRIGGYLAAPGPSVQTSAAVSNSRKKMGVEVQVRCAPEGGVQSSIDEQKRGQLT
jgi:hypothetical protein